MSVVLLVGKGAPERGGIPTFLDLLLHSSLADEHDLRFLNLAGGPPRGGRLSGTNLARTVRDTWRVWRAARGVDVVHVHSALAPAVTMARAGLLAAAGRLRGARVIVHAHGGRVQLWLTTPRRQALSRALLAPAATVIAVSEGGAAALHAARRGRGVRLVDNGVDIDVFTPPPRERIAAGSFRILYVGLLSERKGVLDLLAASDQLAAGGLDHVVVLVGGTPDEGEDAGTAVLEEARRRPGRVVVAGTRPPAEMPATYRDADVFCLPSWWEAMPLSVLEAMATGLPVVATDVGDVGRLLAGDDDGAAGVVVPPRSPEALTAGLRTLASDESLRRSFGGRARRRASSAFDLARTIEAIGDLYRASPDSSP